MSIKSFLNYVNKLCKIGHENGKSHICSAKEFAHILERERCRVDRDNGHFTLILFDLQRPNQNEKNVDPIIALLKNRKLRTTDEMGWMSCKKRIGVLLHNTETKGAMVFVGEISDLMETTDEPLIYQLCHYPDTGNLNGGNSKKEFQVNRLSTNVRNTSDRNSDRNSRSVKQDDNMLFASSFFLESNLSGNGIQESQNENDPFLKRLPAWKRVFDIVGSVICIFFFLPIMISIVIAIKISSKGPVVFKQQRSGLGHKPFGFYKFRSMCLDAECRKKELMEFNEREGPVFKMANDPRVTPVGKFIRKWSLDELPQLFNVLKGDMSLVGPRPPTLDEIPKYDIWQNRRLDITPGITCIWQIYARHDKCFKKWTRMDIEYARNQSFFLDMKILVKTIPAVFSCNGAC